MLGAVPAYRCWLRDFGDPACRDAERVLHSTTPASVATPYLSPTLSAAGVDAEWNFQLPIS